MWNSINWSNNFFQKSLPHKQEKKDGIAFCMYYYGNINSPTRHVAQFTLNWTVRTFFIEF